MLGFDINWRSFEHFEDCVRTGLPSSSKVVPSGFWQYFAEHPEEGRIFDAAMTAKASGQIAAIVQAYDFTRFNLIADIGGGRGHLLRAVLEQAPNARGVLFDLPHVIEAAAGFAFDRLRLQAGDFFRDALPRADAYLLMEVIHDWDDEHSIAILSAIRRAAHKHAEVLLIETLVPDNSGPDWAKTRDIFMLSFLGGSQRTCKEYEALLTQSGFRIEREIATASNVSIIEAVCA